MYDTDHAGQQSPQYNTYCLLIIEKLKNNKFLLPLEILNIAILTSMIMAFPIVRVCTV